MQTQVLSQLLKVAQSSTMGSKHAAAITCGKRLLAIDTNCSLPAGELVDIASTVVARERATSRESRGYSHGHSCSGKRSTTSFNQLYERYQSFEEASHMQFVQRTRCEKHPQIKADRSSYRISASTARRGECVDAL